MSSYSGIPSESHMLNDNQPLKYDVQELIFKFIDTEIFTDTSIICRWGKAEYVIVSHKKFEEYASIDKWKTKSKCFLSYINDVNRLYLEEPLEFSDSELIEFNECKSKYPEVFV